MSLERELKMGKPFSTIQEEAVVSLFATWDLVFQGLHRTLRDYGITLTQYNVLRILRGAGNAGMPLMQIGRRMITRYPNITRLTDRLEADELILRERSTRDRRVVHASVTQKGLKLLSKLDGIVKETNASLMRGANKRQLDQLIQLLENVRLPLRDGDPRRTGH